MAERLNNRFPPIYILVLDELPWASLLDESGRIDAVRYPSFARLGATSHVFSNATTVAFNTELAVPALLTGTLQTQPAPVFSMYPDNLFTLLGGVYDVSSSDPLVDLCPPSVCNGSPPEEILELVAADEATRSGQKAPGSTTSTTADSPPTTTTTAQQPQPPPPPQQPPRQPPSQQLTHNRTHRNGSHVNHRRQPTNDHRHRRNSIAGTRCVRYQREQQPRFAGAVTEGRSHRVRASRSARGRNFRAPIHRCHLGQLRTRADCARRHGGRFRARLCHASIGCPHHHLHSPKSLRDDNDDHGRRPDHRGILATPVTAAPTTEASSATPVTVTPTTEASSAAPVTVTPTTEARPVASDTAATLPTAAAAAAPADADPVDPQRVAEERTAFLDSLITSDTRVADFRAEVAAMEASELPRLHYLHTLLPHVPWRFRPDGSTYADIALPGYFSRWGEDPGQARFGQQRHLLQLGLADRLLGEYLDRLEAIGDFDRATVIVAADHGISFVPGERSRGIGEANVGGIASVPLLYKEPGQRTGTVQHQPVQLIDIVPTIAAQLGLDPPWTFDGRDMFAAGPATDRRVHGPFGAVDVPENLTPAVEALAADMHQVFGDGTTGSLYGLGGAHSLIGTQALDSATAPSQHCWILEQPTTTPDADGSTGYVYGRIDAPAGADIAVALSIDGVVAATARSYREGSLHRVYIVGDPQFWQAREPDVELHEIVGGRLAPVLHC